MCIRDSAYLKKIIEVGDEEAKAYAEEAIKDLSK